jgi:hypothetical protein
MDYEEGVCTKVDDYSMLRETWQLGEQARRKIAEA